MTIKKSTVSQVQKAGHAMHNAAQALSRDAFAAGKLLHQKMSADLHNPAADRLYEQWKSVAKMAQDLVQMENNLRSVYEGCIKISAQLDEVVAAKPAMRSVSAKPSAQVAVPAQAKRRPGGRPPKKALPPGVVGVPRAGNEQRLMEHLSKVLNSTDLVQVQHQQISAATGIPAGSVSATIKRLVGKNLIVTGDSGALRLAAAPSRAASQQTGEPVAANQ